MTKNYYDILGVSKDASTDEIKKAYRKMSLKYHPDRQGGKSESEKKAAEEKFKDINEAYEILSDSRKRAEYDNPIGSGFGNFGGFGGFDPFAGFRSHFSQQPMANPGDDVTATLNITLEDIYKLNTIDVSYMKQVRCGHCHGSGGEGISECPYCHGTGMITEVRQQGFMTMQSSHPCPHCNGTGKTVKHKCAHCSGTGLKVELDSHKVHLSEIPMEYLLQDGTRINMGGYGSQSKDASMPDGNLILTVNLKYDKSVWAIKGKDVYKKVKANVFDMLLGCDINVALPDEKIIKIKVPECTHHGKMLKVTSKGIGGQGDLYIVIESEWPKVLTNEQKKLLKKMN